MSKIKVPALFDFQNALALTEKKLPLRNTETASSRQRVKTKVTKRSLSNSSIHANPEEIPQKIIKCRYNSIHEIPKPSQDCNENTPHVKLNKGIQNRTSNRSSFCVRRYPARFQTKETIRSHLLHQKERIFKIPPSVKRDIEMLRKDKEVSRYLSSSLALKREHGILRKSPSQSNKKKSVQFDI